MASSFQRYLFTVRKSAHVKEIVSGKIKATRAHLKKFVPAAKKEADFNVHTDAAILGQTVNEFIHQ